VSAGLSKRSSQQELLDRGVLKRPPGESTIIAGTAVALEKALASDRVSDTIAQRVRAYVGNASGERASGAKDVEIGTSVKDRMSAYMNAVKESNNSPKSAQMGEGIKERMRAYQDAAKASPTASTSSPNALKIDSPAMEGDIALETTMSSPKMVESKVTDSPPKSAGSVKDRMNAYQEAAAGKVTPKSPVTGGPSLKERLAAYQETAATINVKKQVEIDPVGEGVNQRLSTYMDATSPSKKDVDASVDKAGKNIEGDFVEGEQDTEVKEESTGESLTESAW